MAVTLAFGVFRGVKEVNQFRAYQESLPPSAQTQLSKLPPWRQAELVKAAQELRISPDAMDFYLTESARPGSPLAGLSIPKALRVSSLADQSGKGGFLLDYVARYGYTDALKMAPPEVIKGMANDQFLVQAQDILSNDAGYNVTPERVFTTYPGSTIGKNSTFITNEAPISDIIGDFHGTKTIYVTFDQAVALENALGLEPGTLVNGFRISKISNLGSLDLSYPLKGNTLFLGPGQGLPGGGTEITINPPVPMDSPNVVDQIIIQVYP